VAQLGGRNHVFGAPAPYCDSSVFEYILLPAPLNCACSVKLLKKVILTIPRISRRERRTEKNYFAPQPYPYDNLGETQVCCPPHKRASTGQVWPPCGPGKCPKKGVEVWGTPEKTPPFLGDREKKVPSGSRRRAAQPPRVASKPTPGCLGSTHPKNHLTRRQFSAYSSAIN
jgi:hypothetical protein